MFLSPLQIVSALPLRAGARVADFGCGRGDVALLLSERSQGAVYALDQFPAHIEALHRVSVRRAHPVFPLAADFNEHIPLSAGLLDAGVIANTLHAIRERMQFVSEVARVVKKGGVVLVVEWAASFNNIGPADEVVVTPGEAVRLMKAGGFSPGPMLPAGSHHYAFLSTRV